LAEPAPASRAILAACNLIRQGYPDMTELTGQVGFASPAAQRKFSKRRAGIELLATIALAVSLVIAATAVSIGMARAQALGAVTRNDGGPLAIALCLGLAVVGGSGLAATLRREAKRRRG
jgi:hypothetical protein